MDALNHAIILTMLLAVVWFAAPPAVAYRKGYSGGPWFCALGLVGVFVLAFFPIQRSREWSAERRRRWTLADRIGLGLSAVGILACSGFWVFVLAPGVKSGW